ncbi:MAG: chromate transporter, partial [Sagittula sp.]
MTPYPLLTRVFARIGLLSFGGPAAQIAVMHRELVEERPWLTEAQFLRALSFCMLLPGPEAMQLATYAGWRLRGIPGGLIAGALFVLPGAAVIAILALLYAQYGTRPETEALMLGVKASVIVIVVQALRRLSTKALKRTSDMVMAVAAFLALFAFSLPFPLVIALAAAWGALRSRATGDEPATPATDATRKGTAPATILLWLVLWLLPLPILYVAGQTLLFDLAAFFAKLAVV